MTEQEFKRRTRQFALDVIALGDALPRTMAAQVIGKQLLRCATSVGANYRSACRAKSTADMIAKLSILEEEADESVYWLELLADAHIVPQNRIVLMQKEANEITAMIVASKQTLRRKS